MQYKTAKKEAKRAVAVAKNDAYEKLYQKLDSKGGENEVFRLARAREIQTRDFSTVRCIKDEEGRALVEDAKVQERWQGYFCKLFNGEGLEVDGDLNTELVAGEEQQNYESDQPIIREEVKEALRRMKSGKAVDPIVYLLRFGNF